MSGTKLKSVALSLCLAVFVVRSAAGEGSPGDQASEEKGWRCGYLSRLMEQFGQRGGGGLRGPGDPQPETPWTDVVHTKIDIEVDPSARTVFGTVTVTAEAAIDGLTEFVVYLDPTGGQMDVSGVGGNGTGHSHEGDTVTVALDAEYNTGEQFTVSIEYGGSPTSGIYWGDHYNGSEIVDIVATLSEPFRARGWWVGKDVLDDKCTFDIWVTVPDTLLVASNGILRDVVPVGEDRLRYEWEEINQMIPYLASIAVGDYALYEREYHHLMEPEDPPMPMVFYILPENYNGWLGHCDTYVTQTEVFSDVYGQYPFVNEKGGMAHTPTLGGTYMEHQTIPSMPRFDITWINAHELAHQWWGDNVTCETWGDIWLNEGITSFSEAIWQEFRLGGGTQAYHARMAARRPSNTDAQVYVTDVNNVGSIFASVVYNKGAWVTHMLRHVVGDEVFFQAMLDYRLAHEGSSATTAEFIASISATAGFDLSFFTDQWVMNPGSPDYEYTWLHELSDGQDYCLLKLAQTQWSRGYDLMTMPVDVAVTTDVGTTTYVVWMLNKEQQDTFAIPIDGAPQQVQLDPEDWILTHSITDAGMDEFTAICQGDMDENGQINGVDINAFVAALLETAAGPTAWQRADMDFSGRCELEDLPLFVDALLGLSGCPDG